MRPNNLRHQMALNRFALTFDDRAGERFEYTYQDEKFVNLYTTIRPDGLDMRLITELCKRVEFWHQ